MLYTSPGKLSILFDLSFIPFTTLVAITKSTLYFKRFLIYIIHLLPLPFRLIFIYLYKRESPREFIFLPILIGHFQNDTLFKEINYLLLKKGTHTQLLGTSISPPTIQIRFTVRSAHFFRK